MDYIVPIIFWMSFIIAINAVVSIFIYISLLVYHFYKKHSLQETVDRSLSVIVPIKGVDAYTTQNLELLVKSDIKSPIEFLFAMETEDDPAYVVCKHIKDSFPDKDIHIVLTGLSRTMMGKQHNVNTAAKQARYDVIASMDADVQVSSDTLHEGLQALNSPKAGLIFFLAHYVDNNGPTGGTLVATYLNNFYNILISGGSITGKSPGIIGALWMMPKELLTQCNGLERLSSTVSDDREIGVAIKELGYDIILVPKTVKMPNEDLSFMGGVRHLGKWFGMARAEGFFVYTIISFFFNPMLTSLMTLGIAYSLGDDKSLWVIYLVFVAFIVKIGGVIVLNHFVYRIPTISNLVMTVIYDVFLLPVLYVVNIFNNSIKWKGKIYKIGKHGKILSVK